MNSHDIRGASNILLNMLYGEKEVTMDEIALITDSLQERVGNDVNVIWGAGKDMELGDKLRVAVIATGFNRTVGSSSINSSAAVDNEKKNEIAFKVEELPEDLEMVVMNPADMEEQARQKRRKQEEQRSTRQQQGRQDRDVRRQEEAYERSRRGVNEVPDTSSWIQRKFGNLFNEDLDRDTNMK